MFGHSAMMFKKGCYIDTGDIVNGAGGGFADPGSKPDTGNQDEPEGEPAPDDGDVDDPDQRRTSKQPPEVDSAFAEMRRAKEEAERLRQQLAEYQELEKEYEEYGLKGAKSITEAVRQEKAKRAAANQNEDANFTSWLNTETRKHREAGYDELQIQTWADAQQAKYDNYKIKRELEQERSLRAKEQDERRQAEAVEQGKKVIMDAYRELRKEYPDLLPASAKSADDLVSQLDPKIVDKMVRGIPLEDAFHTVNLKKIARRLVEKNDEKDKDNNDRATFSGRGGGDSSGGTYGLTPRQQALAKENGMTNKQYAGLLKNIKK